MLNEKCYFCGSKEGLMISSRCINGKVKTIDICLRCYWRERFEAEAKGNGKSILSEGEAIERIDPAGSINPLGLRERI